jgi:RNA polymerase sigma factor for flagellar operon FliA
MNNRYEYSYVQMSEEKTLELLKAYRSLIRKSLAASSAGTKKRYENKASYIQNEIVEGNLGLILNEAYRYASPDRSSRQPNGYVFEDFVNEGVLGMIEAIQRFDSKKGTVFSTYAYRWIKKSMATKITIGNLNAPQYKVEIIRRYEKARIQYFVQNGFYPSLEEISEITGISRKVIIDSIRLKSCVSLEQQMPLKSMKGPVYLKDVIASQVPTSSEISDSNERIKILNQIISGLDKSEHRLYNRLYVENKTLREVGLEMETSPQYVQIMKNEMLKKIKRRMKSFGFC